MTLASGMTLLTTSSGSALTLIDIRPGPTANFVLGIPNNPSLCGLEVTIQALHTGGAAGLALSNAYDVRLGR